MSAQTTHSLLTLVAMLLVAAGCQPTLLEPPPEGSNPAPSDPRAENPSGENEGESPGPQTPNDAPETSAPESDPVDVTLLEVDAEGYEETIADLEGKVVLVDFWATWCPPCMKAFPHTLALAKDLPADKFALVTVSLDGPDEKEAALEFLKKQESTAANLLCTLETDEAFEAFDIGFGIPHYKLYNAAGEIVFTYPTEAGNEIDPQVIELKVRELVDGGGESAD